MSIKDLMVDTNEIEEASIETVVKRFFKYDSAGGILFIDRSYWKLPGDKKIALLLAALLGRKFLGLNDPEISATNADIGKILNINPNSTRVYISQLRKNGSVTTDKDRHMITTQGLHDLMEEEQNG